MIEGHPYQTEEFDQLRARQRRDLDTLRRLVPGVFADPPAVIKSVPRYEPPRQELALRRAAEQLLDANRELLSEAENAEDHRIAFWIVREVRGNRWIEASAANLEHLWEQEKKGYDVEVDDATSAQLRDAAMLLLAAEAVASS